MTALPAPLRPAMAARLAVRAWAAHARLAAAAGLLLVAGAALAQGASGTQASAPAAMPAAASAPAAPVVVSLGAGQGDDVLIGYWFLPREGVTPRAQALPVVVALHGCGGLHEAPGKGGKPARRQRADMRTVALGEGAAGTSADAAGALQLRYREYAQWLNARGYAVLMPDSFGPRGRPQGICTESPDARDIDDQVRRADALLALRWLARQPGVDTARVVLLGWSNGAQAVLATIDASRPWPTRTPVVERAVAFYPGCKRAVQQHDYRLRAPLLVMIGGADDWTPATRCAMLQNAVQARQPEARFRLEIYPGAYHGFDGTSELHVRRDVQRHGRGVTVGGDAVARVAALARLDAWLASPDP